MPLVPGKIDQFKILIRIRAAYFLLAAVPAAMLLPYTFCPDVSVSLKTPIRLIGPNVKILTFRGVIFNITLQILLKCRA